ncbi:hypothetical protein [Pseudonocardia sp. 73-21]|uniref:hypothetical protein n=1 Tax=Pseudonocardia sp. 73-21 TaxID=1895809 RepID=UPI00095C0228|nr:hypothetical protein [Pseudonocardia sp. 73-21]OJY47573.1 MAG: hypothetical protein BGP03_33110 [Pseudonocardia sp. 73-21]
MRCARGDCGRLAEVAVDGGTLVLLLCVADGLVAVSRQPGARVVSLHRVSAEVMNRPRRA